MDKQTSQSRRQFLKKSVSATGFSISFSLLPGVTSAAMATGEKAAKESLQAGVFIRIEPDGQLVVTCHRSEMGQQVRTSLAQIVAEELNADWDRVTVEQATGHPKYGDQNTDGSRSVRRNFTRLRQAGASGAHILKQAAADVWQVPVSECYCENHQVVHQLSQKSIDYSQLAAIAGKYPLPDLDKVTLKPREQWTIIGQSTPSVDLDAVIGGTAIYGQDIKFDDMVYAVIQRPPVMFTGVKKFDDSATRDTQGVIDVITLPQAKAPAAFNPLGGVAVIGTNTWAAWQGCNALNVEWTDNQHSNYSSVTYKNALIDSASSDGETVREIGNVDNALAQAKTTINATYYAPLLAQAPMEPPAATVRITDGKVEVWACTQTPQAARQVVAGALGIEPDNVTVNVTFLGGGFGRKSKPDYIAEAALLAKQLNRPVKVVWRREDDIQHGYYHTVSAQHLSGGLSPSGKVTAWKHGTAFPPIGSTFNPAADAPTDGELDLGFIDNPFAIDNMQLYRGKAENHVRIGWLRSVANVYHAFAIQSFANELAIEANVDHKTFLLDLIGKDRHIDLSQQDAKYGNYGDPLETYPIDTARLKNVIHRVTDMADWAQREKQGRFLGLAAHRSFLSYAAIVVEVIVNDSGEWHIPNAYISIDAGTVVNPEHVKAQCEGGMVYGLSCALGQITAKNGVIEQTNFHNYQVARMQHAPKAFHIDIVESTAPPGGVGEPPTPPFAPAFANALFAATGKRIRELPIPFTI